MKKYKEHYIIEIGLTELASSAEGLKYESKSYKTL